jgi:hypothetical protein
VEFCFYFIPFHLVCLIYAAVVAVRNIMCVKCGAIERALCGGCHGGLYCIWKAIEME